ncbi:hypothetical protein ACQEVB_11700 [Pseudonocardia sp. CA-107938]|uniref:hypothetical protein n=1 Tax=Pseudonocardia sp. CA-107938 TaxID=3240021 RepID=UPI003D8B1882
MVRIRVEAEAHNMLPAVLASLAEEMGYKADATRARWDAVAEEARAVTLSRTIGLPAVPKVGDDIWIAPFPDAMVVSQLTWRADPDPEEDDTQITIWVEDLDLDELGDTEGALEAFRRAGWHVAMQVHAELELDDE